MTMKRMVVVGCLMIPLDKRQTLTIRGDANYDMSLHVAVLTYLVDYLSFAGPSPPPCP